MTSSDTFKTGVHVFTSDSVPINDLKKWIKKVSDRSGQKVDYHFNGARYEIIARGDISKVVMAIIDLIDEHDKLKDVNNNLMI